MPLPEPRVTLQVEGNPVSFLVDTGAEYSVITKTTGKLSNKTSWVQGATGIKPYQWTTQRKLDLSSGQVSHAFMVIPECPTPLLGRDILTKLKARIYFEEEGIIITDNKGNLISSPRVTQILTLAQADEYRLYQPMKINQEGEMSYWLHEFPEAWAETGGAGWAKHRPPLYIELKPGAEPARVRQYPMPQEAKTGITPHIRRLLDAGILRKCQSAWNTPLLPVRKPGG